MLAILSLVFVIAAADKPLNFDVASVKVTSLPNGVSLDGEGRVMVSRGSGVSMPRKSGGPGTDDPGRIHYPFITVKSLLRQAWDSYYEIKGPGWLDTDVVAIEATMPSSTTKEQFQEMLRNLVVDRFALKYHAETKDAGSYSLSVAKTGLRIKESPNQNEAASGLPMQRPASRDADGFPILPPRAGPWIMSMGTADNRTRVIGQQQTMQELARYLGRNLNAIVTDTTGLGARYDFIVTYSGGMGPGAALRSQPDAADPLPDIFTALQSVLGLKLEAKKVPVQVMVIDHMEKTPAGN